LTFQVKGACGSSDKALGLGTHGFRTYASHAGLDCGALNAIPLADNDDFFTFEIHMLASFDDLITPTTRQLSFLFH
jgi:hypothetical protein